MCSLPFPSDTSVSCNCFWNFYCWYKSLKLPEEKVFYIKLFKIIILLSNKIQYYNSNMYFFTLVSVGMNRIKSKLGNTSKLNYQEITFPTSGLQNKLNNLLKEVSSHILWEWRKERLQDDTERGEFLCIKKNLGDWNTSYRIYISCIKAHRKCVCRLCHYESVWPCSG